MLVRASALEFAYIENCMPFESDDKATSYSDFHQKQCSLTYKI